MLKPCLQIIYFDQIGTVVVVKTFAFKRLCTVTSLLSLYLIFRMKLWKHRVVLNSYIPARIQEFWSGGVQLSENFDKQKKSKKKKKKKRRRVHEKTRRL